MCMMTIIMMAIMMATIRMAMMTENLTMTMMMGTMMMTTVAIFVTVYVDVDDQAKEEESRGKIANNLEEEKSKEVQGMVNRLTFLPSMTSELML